jgi:AraC-like DNA-binding protein
MIAAPAPKALTVFSLDVAQLAAHTNAATCILAGRRAPVSVSRGGQTITADFLLVRAGFAHEVHAPGSGFSAFYLGEFSWPDGEDWATPLVGPLAYQAADAMKGCADSQQEVRRGLEHRTRHTSPAIDNVIRRIAEDPMHRMTQFELERRLGVERTAALRMFKAATGQTFRSYKRWSAMLHAIHQIIAGTPIRAAAIDSGFADTAHFSRTFRHTFGLSPTQALHALAPSHHA